VTGFQSCVLPFCLFTNYWPVSSFIPFVNYNNNQRAGVDFNLTLHQQSNDLNWSLGVVGAFYTNKALRREELNEENYQNRAGKNVDAMFGLDRKSTRLNS